jgi:hypothetical protein
MTEDGAVVLGLLADPYVPSQVHAESRSRSRTSSGTGSPLAALGADGSRSSKGRWRRMNKAQCAS